MVATFCRDKSGSPKRPWLPGWKQVICIAPRGYEMKSFILRLVLIAATLAVVPFAQTQQATKPNSAPASQSGAQASHEMQSLITALSGRWSLAVQAAGSATPTKGEETWRPGPGGLTFIEEETLHIPGHDILLLGVLWWDGNTKSLHGMECNNGLSYVCDVKGALTDITLQWDGTQLVLIEQENHNGKKSVWRETFSDITKNSFTQTGDSTDANGHTTRLLTIHATRLPEGS